VTFELGEARGTDALQDPAFLSEVGAALASSGLVVIRGCSGLQDPQLLSLLEQFGTIATDGSHGEPVTDLVTRFDENGSCLNKLAATRWHLDYSFRERPSGVAMLYCVTPSDDEVCTHFCDMYELWRDLPAHLLNELATVKALHCFNYAAAQGGVASDCTVHDLFFRNLVNDRIVLYFSESKIAHFLGCPPATERAARESIMGLLDQSDRSYAHSWRAGDIVLFDGVGMAHRRDEIPGRSFRHVKYLTTAFRIDLTAPVVAGDLMAGRAGRPAAAARITDGAPVPLDLPA
jgi:alpha-ketoglutarate-dependent taurine dioxygenase